MREVLDILVTMNGTTVLDNETLSTGGKRYILKPVKSAVGALKIHSTVI
jgi:hypothetical protein